MNLSYLIANTKQTAYMARESSDSVPHIMSTSIEHTASDPSVYPTPVPTNASSHTLPAYHLNSVDYADSSHSIVPMSLISPDSSNVSKLYKDPVIKSSAFVMPRQSTTGDVLDRVSVLSTQTNFGDFPTSVLVNIVPTSSGLVLKSGSVITEETRTVKESTSGISEVRVYFISLNI
jgi:hypothetical protein